MNEPRSALPESEVEQFAREAGRNIVYHAGRLELVHRIARRAAEVERLESRWRCLGSWSGSPAPPSPRPRR